MLQVHSPFKPCPRCESLMTRFEEYRAGDWVPVYYRCSKCSTTEEIAKAPHPATILARRLNGRYDD